MSVSSTGAEALPERIGRYSVGVALGHGGFALVVKAHDEGLDDDVAVKVLDTDQAFDPELRERFVREARLLRRVQDPHVISVHDIGELDDARPYFVMDYAGGGVLSARFENPARQASPGDLRTVVLALRSGLGALHRAGVVHRDIKPDNLLVISPRSAGDTRAGPDAILDDERVVIGDLGLAKDRLDTRAGPTILGGTPRFRAPEQLDRGAAITPATDTFAATAVLWWLLNGRLPPEPSALEGELVDVAEAWIPFFRQGLAVDPDNRYATIERWADAALGLIELSHTDAGTTGIGTRVATGVCPYKGLAAYQPEDAPLFFGREVLVDELISRLQVYPTMVIAGPSGSGKSSLLRAGLIPAVERGALTGSHEWPIVLFTPGTRALRELHTQLERLLPGSVPPVDELRREPSTMRAAGAAQTSGLLAIDQFEEVFTSSPGDVEAFVATLAEVARPDYRLRVVVALRADFYADCAAHPWLARIINDNQVLVGPMQRNELRRAIEGPARRAGLRFEGGLVDQILDDAGAESGSLPLVAHALMETWRRRRGSELTTNGYEAAGGVAGAIAQSADHAYERQSASTREHVRRLFLRLVNPGDDNVATRRKLPWSDIDEDTRPLIEEWADARLLTVGADGVEITHEALLDTWPRLHQWIEESRDDLRVRLRIGRAAEVWRADDRDPALLYRGTPLASALAWAEEHDGDLSATEREFLDASAAQRDAQERADEASRRRRQRRRNLAFVALAGLTVAAVIASVFAFVALDRSNENQDRAVAAERAAADTLGELVALQGSGEDPMLAVMLAAEGVARSTSAPVGARNALFEARRALADAGPVPLDDGITVTGVTQVDVSDDGELFAIGQRDGTIAFGRFDEPSAFEVVSGHRDGIEALVFNPTGTELASVGVDGSVRVWDLAASPPTSTTLFDLGTIGWDLAYDSTGRRLAVVSEAGELIVFDADTGALLEGPLSMAGEPIDFLSVVFGPDDDTVIVGSGTGEVFTWSLSQGTMTADVLPAHTSDVWELGFDPSGERFMTVSSDGRVRLWDAATGDMVGEPLTVEGVRLVTEAKGGVWLPDGTILVGSDDGTLWAIDPDTTGSAEAAINGLHRDRIIDLAVSADGRRLVSVGDDQRIRFIDNSDRAPLVDPVAQLGAGAFALAVRDDGLELAVGDDLGQVHLLDPTSESRAVVAGLAGRVRSVRYFDEGRRLAAGDESGGLTIATVADRMVAAVVDDAHSGALTDIAISPDGERLVTVGDDGAIRAWSAGDLSPAGVHVPGEAELTAVVFVEDDVVLASSATGQLVTWTVGDERSTLRTLADDTIWDLAISPDGTRLAVASASEAVWLYATDDLDGSRQELSPFRNGATGLAFSADGTALVTVARADGEVRYWDVASGAPLGTALTSHAGGDGWAVATTRRGLISYSAGTDGSVQSVDALDLATACGLAERSLGSERRETFVDDETLMACTP